MKTSKQRKLDEIYLKMAKTWSENSYAIRRQVGCLIVKDNMIISDGYNGTPSGFENVCEDLVIESSSNKKIKSYNSVDELKEKFDLARLTSSQVNDCDGCLSKVYLQTKPYVLHAEANAITKLAKSGNSSDGATLYVTDEPCLECSKMIIQAGIVRVVYMREYHSHGGIDILKRAGIKVEQLKYDENEDV